MNIFKIILLSAMLAFSFSLTGCQSTNSDVTEVVTSSNTTTTATYTGIFVDSQVAGLTYICGTNTGTTDIQGKFYGCATNVPVTFKLGNLVLGTADYVQGGVFTPRILAEAIYGKDTADANATTNNIASIILSLDNDGNASNGITLDPVDIATFNTTVPVGTIVTTVIPDTVATAISTAVTALGSTKIAVDPAVAEIHLVETEALITQGVFTQVVPSISGSVTPIDVNASTTPNTLIASISSVNEFSLNADKSISVVVTDTATPVGINLTAFNSGGSSKTEGTILVGYPYVNGSPVTYLGTITPSAGVTLDSNGMASFSYNPPANLTYIKSLGYNGAKFVFYSSLSTEVNTTVEMLFTDLKYNNYVLKVFPENNVTVSQASESKVIELYLENNLTTLPVSNESVTVDFFDATKGTLNAFSGSTDSNGHITFNYTAPSTIIALSPFDIKFKLSKDITKTVSKTIVFDNTIASDLKYANYVLKAYPENNVTITTNSQSQVLEVYLEDNVTKLPVSGETVIVEFFDASQGVMSAFSSTTDSSGHVAFNYTAPSDITKITPLNVIFKLSGDVKVTNSTMILFDTTVQKQDYSNYNITSVPADVNITAGLQSKVIDVYVEDNRTTPAKPAVGEVITVDYFDGSKGTMSAFSATTDANGHAAFNYTSIENVVDTTQYALTFRMDSNSSKTDTTKLLVNTAVTAKDYTNYNITSVPSDVNITAGRVLE